MSRFDIKEPRPHAIIDIDHYVDGNMPLDFEKIKEQLISLRRVPAENEDIWWAIFDGPSNDW